MDYCGFAKDNFYYYKSWWSNEPVIHIFPHWNMQERTGEKISVYCYGNSEEIELLVNGVSYGKKTMEKHWYLEWDDVVYNPGKVQAIGYNNGIEVISETVKTTKAPYEIRLKAVGGEVHAESRDVAIINVEIVDEDGLIVPTADNLIRFDVIGDGDFYGVGNGNPGSHESDKVPMRRAFRGLCQLLVKAHDKPGEIKIKAYGEGLKSCSIPIYTIE